MTLVVDNTSSLTVELKDDSKEISDKEAIGLATYTNSQSTVQAYISIFENMWMHSELQYTTNKGRERRQMTARSKASNSKF
jgi:hypothetical protein